MGTIPKEFDSVLTGPKVREKFQTELNPVFENVNTDPHKFIKHAWELYSAKSNSLNGSIFESLLSIVLISHKIHPFYLQAKLAFIPNVEFDFVLYDSKIGPIALSAKTSLRERYKQADLEGMMMRQVHRQSKSYLITLDSNEAKTVERKITEGTILGIDQVLVATDKAFDSFILDLTSKQLIRPNQIEVITGRIISP